jgi:glutaredoxin
MAVKNITIYTTHTCPFCKMEKQFLDDHQLGYKEIFVDDEETMKHQMINLSGQMGTPVTLVEYDDGEKRQFVGFDQTKLTALVAGEKVGEAPVQEVT